MPLSLFAAHDEEVKSEKKSRCESGGFCFSQQQRNVRKSCILLMRGKYNGGRMNNLNEN